MNRLAEIAGRADAAASGPWVKDEMKFVVSDPPRISVEDFQAYEIASMIGPTDYARANATFIAHARTDVPALLRAVESYRSMLRSAFALNTGNDKTKTELLMTTADAAALAALEGE